MQDFRRIVGLDTESWLIDRALVAPPLVCMQYTQEVSVCEPPTYRSGGEVLHLLLSPDQERARSIFEKWLASSVILVLHNAAHDIACFIVHWPDLAEAILDKLARGEIHCTVMRQKLLDCALGRLQDEKFTDEDYGLEAVAAGFGYDKDASDPWRKRYAELWDVPVELWPYEADKYARKDPEAAVVVWLGQERCDETWAAARGSSVLYAGGGVGECSRRTEASFDLHTARAWGLRTHQGRTEALMAETRAKIEAWRVELQAAGLVRALTDRGRSLALSRLGLKLKPKDPIQKKQVDETPDSALLHQLSPEERTLYADPDPSTPKATKQARMLSATAAYPQRRKLTKTGEAKARERADAMGLKGRRAGDLRQYLTPEEQLAYISCDADAAVLSGDPDLIKVCDYGSAGNLLTGVEDLAEGYELPLQAGFDALKATGRTSSFKPGKGSPLRGKQLQNFDKDSGARTCCIPRPGNGYIQVDMPGAELHAHAQNCMEQFKTSRLAEELNAGIDPLLAFGIKKLGVPYADAFARKKEKQFKDARSRSKPALYGFPGGMGDEKFVLYSRAQWDTLFTLEEAGQLRREWLDHYYENQLYFDWVGKNERANGGAIRQFKSERWRGAATYTAKCNGYFQGRCADAMLSVLRVVVRETFRRTSPLYGFHLVNYVHDEIIMEGPLDRCSDAAKRLSAIALTVFNEWIDLVPIKAEKMEPTVMLCWSKDAAPILDANGNLLPWDLPAEAT